ncbi:hypothetical protein GCM10020331_054910 [Ectobacillus funiculus]
MGKWFARVYDSLMLPLERKGLRNTRKKYSEESKRKRIGDWSGTGLNFPYYEQAKKVSLLLNQIL